MKRKSYLLLSLLLASCTQGSYIKYYGTVELTSFSMEYERVDDKEIVNYESISASPLYSTLYLIEDQEDLNFFLTRAFISGTREDREKYGTIDEYTTLLAVFVQIPEGYSINVRHSIQEIDDEGETILVTPSFYSYRQRPDISYFFIDVQKDEQSTERTVKCLLARMKKTTSSNIEENTIRPILEYQELETEEQEETSSNI